MFVSVTRLRIRKLWDMPAFAVQALRSALQAKNAKGNVSVALLAEARRTFWTRTIWIEESAMRSFMLGEPHRRAMSSLTNVPKRPTPLAYKHPRPRLYQQALSLPLSLKRLLNCARRAGQLEKLCSIQRGLTV
jgi:hypothetical protein